MRLIFHVGLHKTGTTALQRSVFPNLEGIVYFGRSGRAALGTTLLEKGDNTLLYSDETMLGRLLDIYAVERGQRDSWPTVQVRAMRHLKTRFPRCEMIIGLRRHTSWLESIYKHYLKYGGSKAFEDFFRMDGRGRLAPDDLLLGPRLRSAAKIFGGRMHVIWLEDLATQPAVELSRLADYVGAHISPELRLQRENEGLSYVASALVRSMNRWPLIGGCDHLDRRDAPARFLRRTGITPYRLATKLASLAPMKAPVKLPNKLRTVLDEYFAEDLKASQAIIQDLDSQFSRRCA